jgi:hypothetical protein
MVVVDFLDDIYICEMDEKMILQFIHGYARAFTFIMNHFYFSSEKASFQPPCCVLFVEANEELGKICDTVAMITLLTHVHVLIHPVQSLRSHYIYAKNQKMRARVYLLFRAHARKHAHAHTHTHTHTHTHNHTHTHTYTHTVYIY